MAKQLVSISKNWEGSPEIDTYIPSLEDNANIEEALKLFMYGNIENGTEYDEKSLYYFLTTYKTLIENNSTTIAGHTAQSNNVHNLGTAGPAGSDGGNIVGTSAQQTLTNKTITNPIFTGSLTLPISGSGLAPVGTIVMYGGTTAPSGWLVCNGQSTSGYTALAAVVGANVPDLMGRAPIGYGDSADNTEVPTNYTTIGAKFGAETVTLTALQSGIRSHTHVNTVSISGDGAHAHNIKTRKVTSSTHDHDNSDANVGPSTAAGSGAFAGTTQSGAALSAGHSHSVSISNASHAATVAEDSHLNMQPSTVVNFIIKY